MWELGRRIGWRSQPTAANGAASTVAEAAKLFKVDLGSPGRGRPPGSPAGPSILPWRPAQRWSPGTAGLGLGAGVKARRGAARVAPPGLVQQEALRCPGQDSSLLGAFAARCPSRSLSSPVQAFSRGAVCPVFGPLGCPRCQTLIRASSCVDDAQMMPGVEGGLVSSQGPGEGSPGLEAALLSWLPPVPPTVPGGLQSNLGAPVHSRGTEVAGEGAPAWPGDPEVAGEGALEWLGGRGRHQSRQTTPKRLELGGGKLWVWPKAPLPAGAGARGVPGGRPSSPSAVAKASPGGPEPP